MSVGATVLPRTSGLSAAFAEVMPEAGVDVRGAGIGSELERIGVRMV